jgi:hypothetical protein
VRGFCFGGGGGGVQKGGWPRLTGKPRVAESQITLALSAGESSWCFAKILVGLSMQAHIARHVPRLAGAPGWSGPAREAQGEAAAAAAAAAEAEAVAAAQMPYTELG